jgi:hypothetical protein
MMNKLINLYLFGLILFIGYGKSYKTVYVVSSPSKNISVEFFLKIDGSLNYLVKHKDVVTIDTSIMGFEFKYQASMEKGFRIIGSETDAVNETWEMPWGEQRIVNNHYSEPIMMVLDFDMNFPSKMVLTVLLL